MKKTISLFGISLLVSVFVSQFAYAENPPSLMLPDNPPALELPPTCNTWTYSDWGTCSNGNQTRTILTSDPAGCTGGSPVLTQACNNATCNTWTYSNWGTCSNGNQTRTVLTSSPASCTGGSPSITQSCSNPAPNPDTLEITKLNVDPKSINPLLGDVTIKYKVSKDAVVELKIEDESNALIVKLADDESVTAGQEQTVTWNGTDKKDTSGKVVKAGKYFYKLLAKDKTSKEIKDTKTGEITVFYSDNVEGNTGDVAADGNGGGSDISAHNNPPKKTSGTGPETLVYLLFPVASYLYHRNKKRK